MAKPDLNKLKSEIETRKREKNSKSPTGEQVAEGASPRDMFLYGLMESWKSGRENNSTNLVKFKTSKMLEKLGEQPVTTQVAQPVQRVSSQPQQLHEIDMSPERDEQFFNDIEKKRRQTLAESIEQFSKTPVLGSPMMQSQNVPTQLNEAYLTENVTKIVNNYLVENFGPVIEEAIKGTILEMYAIERIKDVLQENKEMIKSIVYETIRELQAKSKAKMQH
jgi:hypothetical protein